MSSFALPIAMALAGPPMTAEQVIAAHRARTSVAEARTGDDCRRAGEALSEDEVLVCARRLPSATAFPRATRSSTGRAWAA